MPTDTPLPLLTATFQARGLDVERAWIDMTTRWGKSRKRHGRGIAVLWRSIPDEAMQSLCAHFVPDDHQLFHLMPGQSMPSEK